MSDLISREEVLRAIITSGEVEPDLGYTHLHKVIENLPSAEPKRGKWRHYEGVLTCIECGAEFNDDIMEYTGDEVPHFCPYCGANMEAIE